jgi:microcystin-dependent protein
MASPYIGEIRCFGFNFAPIGWALCNGQLLSIAENNALFAILGTIYGGDGTTTFGLPNLQGQIPMHWGNGPGGFNTAIGQVQGVTTVTLITSQIPIHTHTVTAVEVPSGGDPERTAVPASNTFLGPSQVPNAAYQKTPASVTAAFSNKAISIQGGSQPHDNMQPYLTLNFCIALEGIFPSQN